MTPDKQHIQQCLNAFDFHTLFIEELGWDQCRLADQIITLDAQVYILQPIAQKRGMVAYLYTSKGSLPDKMLREKVEKEIAKLIYEHIIIYSDVQQYQVWQWVRREHERIPVQREVRFYKGRSNEHLVQRLMSIAFDAGEESKLSVAQVASRTRKAFDLERITTRFYTQFQQEHAIFMSFIQGITALVDREWYTSLMLNRLMFVYFIQKKGFLDNNVNYLPEKLHMVQEKRGKDTFLSFYRHFLLRLFHEGLNMQKTVRPSDLEELLGNVPYLNGGLFEVHELERDNQGIQIPDDAFARIFTFFDSYQWQIDERPLRFDGEINPDVIGYIFEKYINQKQMGAYYRLYQQKCYHLTYLQDDRTKIPSPIQTRWDHMAIITDAARTLYQRNNEHRRLSSNRNRTRIPCPSYAPGTAKKRASRRAGRLYQPVYQFQPG
jgi:hypothetical protein